MIPEGLPGAGNILVFDNGGFSVWGAGTGRFNKYLRMFSRVLEFDPTTFQVVWEYSPSAGDLLAFSHIVSSAQRLPNGNTLIASGLGGQFLEVTPAKEIVWEYQNEYAFNGATTIYRALRVPPEWIPGNPVNYPNWE